jgi:cell wall-associated NlpC family hydrolase
MRPDMLRPVLVLLSLALCCGTAHASVTLGNWDAAQQRQVARAGLMSDVGSSFNGALPLTAAQANATMDALAARLQAAAVHTTRSPVTVTSFDAMLVDQLGLADVAAHVQAATAAVGLRPPSYYGTEVVARFLGLRFDHPSGTDQLELFPYDPITRAEAAWSLAQILGFGDWNAGYAQQTLSSYRLPKMTANQLTTLRIAVSRIGYPYVYAGESDAAEPASWMWGPQAHGGFDCSGFVWRVFKLSGLPWGQRIGGRTAAQMAGEIPRRARLRMSQLRPGDLLFFGSAHFSSPASEAGIIHAGIYLGDNWAIHSSGQGVYVLPLRGSWLGDQFAWGRRVIP